MSALSPLRWPRPKPPSPTDPRHNDKNTSTKRSLNALFGIKSKKHPAEPPPTVTSVLSDRNPSPVLYANRPPSKSVSSTQSRVDSIGPKTPNSVRESRQSLLTLSDHDPFAGRGITVVTSPQSVIGSNRVSIRSNSSLPDAIGGKLDNRALFPPPIMISPKERSLSPDFALFSGHSIVQPDVGPVLRASSAGFSGKRSGTALDAAFSTAAEERQMKSGSSSTLTDTDRPPIPPRPPTRPRGLTESAATHRSGSYLNHRGTISSGTPSRGLVRQVSLARLGCPPSAPPIQELPPPPVASIQPNADASIEDDDAALAEAIIPSALPFICASSDTILLHSPRRKCKQPDSGLTCPEKSPVSPRKLKKAVSHNSLAKLSIPTSSFEPLPIHMNEGKVLGEYSSPKSSSHQPKLQPLPIISRPPSTLPMPSSPGGKSPHSEQRRGSNSSLPSRRRLFSASRRPSISQGNSMEDDAQSIFSLGSEQNLPVSPSLPWARSSSCSPSFDDTTSDEPSSPQHSSRYTPQHIMSPAAMAEVEASVEFITSPRSRGMSISTITSSTDRDEELWTPSTSPALSPFSSSCKSSTFPSRSSSLLFTGSISPPQRITARPSTSQANMTSPTIEQPTYRPSSSPPLSLISLPPPPRPRQRTTTAPPSSRAPADIKRLDTTFLRPSSSSSKVSTDVQLHHNTGFQTHLHHNPGFQTHLQPPRKTLLPKKSMEKFFRRRSLLRKPSFLEIDDEVTQDIVDKDDPGGSPGDSFLDLTRESFDTNAN